MTTFLIRELLCPLCGTAFQSRQVGSTNPFGPLTSDLRRHAVGADPLPFDVHACPACGWSASEAPWGEQGALAAAEVAPGERLADRVRAELGTAPAQGDAAARYEAAARCAAWAGLGALREGDHWLRAAWMHGDAGRAGAERTCRERAAAAYGHALATQEGFRRRQDLVVVHYLLGELLRRLGRTDDARGAFDEAIRHAAPDPGLADLAALARRQIERPEEFVGGR